MSESGMRVPGLSLIGLAGAALKGLLSPTLSSRPPEEEREKICQTRLNECGAWIFPVLASIALLCYARTK